MLEAIIELGPANLLNEIVHTCGSALWLACRTNAAAAVRALCRPELGCLDLPGPDGTRGLHWAAHHNAVPLVELLVKGRNSGVNKQDPHGMTPIAFAVQSGAQAATLKLSAMGADPCIVNGAGAAALHGICASCTPALRVVIIDGALGNVNVRRGTDDKTPLHIAAEAGSLSFVTALLAKGADANAPTGKGDEYLAVLAARGAIADAEIADMLQGAAHLQTFCDHSGTKTHRCGSACPCVKGRRACGDRCNTMGGNAYTDVAEAGGSARQATHEDAATSTHSTTQTTVRD
jgi:ankyrin repeat protein